MIFFKESRRHLCLTGLLSPYIKSKSPHSGTFKRVLTGLYLVIKWCSRNLTLEGRNHNAHGDKSLTVTLLIACALCAWLIADFMLVAVVCGLSCAYHKSQYSYLAISKRIKERKSQIMLMLLHNVYFIKNVYLLQQRYFCYA